VSFLEEDPLALDGFAGHSQGKGTAFCMDSGGIYLCTNFHVAGRAVKVEIAQGSLGNTRYQVAIAGLAPDIDYAVLYVPADVRHAIAGLAGWPVDPTGADTRLQSLKWGNSEVLGNASSHIVDLRAYGHSLGMPTMKSTDGTYSGRDTLEQEYITHTATINHGNSGGPLVWRNPTTGVDEVVGINSAGMMGANNTYFAIPVNTIESMHMFITSRFDRMLAETDGDALEAMMNVYDTEGVIVGSHRELLVRVPVMGADIQEGSAVLSRMMGGTDHIGPMFTHVVPGGNAARAEPPIEAGDILVAIEDHNGDGTKAMFEVDATGNYSHPMLGILVSSKHVLKRYVPGQVVQLSVMRKVQGSDEGRAIDITMTLHEDENSRPSIRRYYWPYEKPDSEVLMGVTLVQLSVNSIERIIMWSPGIVAYNQPEFRCRQRVLVSGAAGMGSVADQVRAVARAGDLIGTVNGTTTHTVEEVRAAVRATVEAGGDMLTLHFEGSGTIAAGSIRKWLGEFTSMLPPNTVASPFVAELVALYRQRDEATAAAAAAAAAATTTPQNQTSEDIALEAIRRMLGGRGFSVVFGEAAVAAAAAEDAAAAAAARGGVLPSEASLTAVLVGSGMVHSMPPPMRNAGASFVLRV
jgi:S1-C subfamily serine protease